MSIKDCLDERLVAAENNKDPLPLLAIINGLTGFGKTPIIKEWLEEKGLDYSLIDVPTLNQTEVEVEVDDFGSLFKGQTVSVISNYQIPKKKIKITTIFSSDEIDRMNQDRHVIILDNYDWGRHPIRKDLLRLISKSNVRDIREVNNNYVKNLSNLFLLIIVVHPDYENGMDEYDDFEKEIFGEHLHL